MKIQTTPATKKSDILRKWYLIDASDKVLGRLATICAGRLSGKNKVNYAPYLDGGDHVVVINIEKVVVTGNKGEDKMYYRHSGYPGGLKQASFNELLERRPEDILKKAVKGMLPKNRQTATMLRRLHLVVGSTHPFNNQSLEVVE